MEDYWELQNAEESHKRNPDSFWLPDLDDRKSLKRGDAAKLIFNIKGIDENGDSVIEVERIFVIVSERVGDQYIGILDAQPLCIDKNQEGGYLCFGAEIPFSSEHVIVIDRPPEEYIEWQLGQPPEREWPRG